MDLDGSSPRWQGWLSMYAVSLSTFSLSCDLGVAPSMVGGSAFLQLPWRLVCCTCSSMHCWCCGSVELRHKTAWMLVFDK